MAKQNWPSNPQHGPGGTGLGTPILNPDGKYTQSKPSAGNVAFPTGSGYVSVPRMPAMPGSAPPGPTTTTGGGGSSRGGGGGYGGMSSAAKSAGILGLLNNFRPQKYTFNPYEFQEFDAPEFYDFDDSKYTDLQSRIAAGAEADIASGNAAIDEALAQINNTPIGFQGGQWATNPEMSQAMQRMYGAQGMPTSLTDATMAEGIQADAAFGNVMALLGENARQKRASDLMALEGDRRRMTENIQALSSGMDASVALSMANALEQYKKDKMMYGYEVARMNWEARQNVGMYNNQGRNQVGQANTQMVNETNQNAMNILADLIASGVAVDPNAYKQVT